VAGTWVREEEGVLQKLVISKTDASWYAPWELDQNEEDWKMMTESLRKNLQANNIRLEEDGEFLRVV
jgi:heme A synthase